MKSDNKSFNLNMLWIILAGLLAFCANVWSEEPASVSAEPAEAASQTEADPSILERRGALVSFESTVRKGQEERAGTLISWEQYRPKPAEPDRPLPPLVLPQEPNFVRSASLRYQFETEEEPLPELRTPAAES